MCVCVCVCVSVTSHTLPHWAVAHILHICGCSLFVLLYSTSKCQLLYYMQQEGDTQFEAVMAAEFNKIFLGQWPRQVVEW